jgi:hypothetical protein
MAINQFQNRNHVEKFTLFHSCYGRPDIHGKEGEGFEPSVNKSLHSISSATL